MIQLQLHELIFVYAATGLGIVLFAAWCHGFLRTRQERAARRRLLKCGFCAFEFGDESNTVLPRCPRCHGLVERRPLSRL